MKNIIESNNNYYFDELNFDKEIIETTYKPIFNIVADKFNCKIENLVLLNLYEIISIISEYELNKTKISYEEEQIIEEKYFDMNDSIKFNEIKTLYNEQISNMEFLSGECTYGKYIICANFETEPMICLQYGIKETKSN